MFLDGVGHGAAETMTTPAAPRHRHAVRFIILTVLIDAAGFGIVMPVLPRLVMTLGHVGLADATRIGGWLGVVYAAVQFLMGPLVGNLGDRFGRRLVLLGSLGGFAIDYTLLGFAPSLGWLFVGRALAGLFGASFGPAGAAMADISAPEDRARHFGMIGAAFGIAFIIGPAIGGLLGEVSPRAPFYAAGALAGFNFVFGLFVFPETLAPEHRRPFDWARANPLGALLALGRLPGVLPIAFAAFWWNLANMVYPAAWAYFAIAAFGWSTGMIGASLAWVGVLMAMCQMLIVGRVVARLGERRAALVGMGFGLAGYVPYIFIRNGWLSFVVMGLTFLFALVMPAMNGMMSRRVPANAQGELQGFNGSISALGAILAPLLYNPTLAWFTGGGGPVYFPGIVFAMAAGSTLLAIVTLALAPRAQMPPGTAS